MRPRLGLNTGLNGSGVWNPRLHRTAKAATSQGMALPRKAQHRINLLRLGRTWNGRALRSQTSM